MDNLAKTVKICGRTFNMVKSGIDPKEVAVLMKEMTDEKEALVKRQDSLSSLTRLYEKTVIEADNLAKQIQSEARTQAQKEANEILMQAHERARNIVEEKANEAMVLVQQRVKIMKAEIKGQLSGVMNDELSRIQGLIQDTAHQISESMIEKAENLVRNVGKVDLDLDSGNTVDRVSREESVDLKYMKTIAADDDDNGSRYDTDSLETAGFSPAERPEINKTAIIHGNLKEEKNIESSDKIDDFVFNLKPVKPVTSQAGLKETTRSEKGAETTGDGHKRIVISLTAKTKNEIEKIGTGTRIWNTLTEK